MFQSKYTHKKSGFLHLWDPASTCWNRTSLTAYKNHVVPSRKHHGSIGSPNKYFLHYVSNLLHKDNEKSEEMQ